MIDAEMIKADLLSLDTRDFYIKYIVKSKKESATRRVCSGYFLHNSSATITEL